MNAIKWILEWSRNKGYGAMYGNPAHINRMMSDVDYLQCTDDTAVFCHLITASETANGGHDRATIGVFFSRLCDFDFDPEGLLDVQDDLKSIGKSMLNEINAGNVFGYEEPVRWQYGYDDYADNVAWVCMRVTLENLAADCVPFETPEIINPIPKQKMWFYSAMGLSPETHGWAVAADDGINMKIGIAIVSIDNPPSSISVFNLHANGEEYQNGYTKMVITSAFAANKPWLQPYVGLWLTECDLTIPLAQNYSMTADFGDFWHGELIEW